MSELRRRVRRLDEEVRRAEVRSAPREHDFKIGDEVRLREAIAGMGVGYVVTVREIVHNFVCVYREHYGTNTIHHSKIEQAYRCCLDPEGKTGTWYSTRTPEGVVLCLERLRYSGARVRLHYGDRETGRDSLQEHDVEGRISRSTGPKHIPLLIHNTRSAGGGHLLDDNIVKIRTTGQRVSVLYQHPKYHAGKISAHELAEDSEVRQRHPELKYEIRVDDKGHACFKSLEHLRRWTVKMGVIDMCSWKAVTACQVVCR